MSCASITCPTFANPEFMAQVVIATVRAAGTYSFGTFKEGTYKVAYLQGANRWLNLWLATSGDPQTMTVHACGGTLSIKVPVSQHALSQSEAEGNAAGVEVCFEHSGGEISLQFASSSYASNQNGNPNPTFNLFRQGSAIPPSPPQPIPATPFSNQSFSLFHCGQKVDCEGVDLPIRNFSSEAVDIPSEPVLPGGNPSLPSNPPVAGGSEPPVIPPPISPETGGGTAIVEINPPEPPPAPPIPPDPPPPPPQTSYNCVDGNCVDPGDGSGTYATLEECSANCVPTPPPPPCHDITPSGAIAAQISPIDCACSQDVYFTSEGFAAPTPGYNYTLTVNPAGNWILEYVNGTTLKLPAASACALAAAIASTSGAGTYAGTINNATPEVSGCPVTVQIVACLDCSTVFPENSYTPCGGSGTVSCAHAVQLLSQLAVGQSIVVDANAIGAFGSSCFDVELVDADFYVLCGTRAYKLDSPAGTCPPVTLTRTA